MLIASLLITAKKWKPPSVKCPVMNGHNEWYILMMEYYLIIKMSEILIFVIVWIDPENLMLSERSQTRKVTWYMIPFISNFKNRKTL